MKKLFSILKNKDKNPDKRARPSTQTGSTYIELIVVLSIFAIIASVAIFNYKKFQTRVDINNLGSDIALKVVQAQKDSTSGRIPPVAVLDDNWKPSYGVYFGAANELSPLTWFAYFVDIHDDGQTPTISPPVCNGECLEIFNITKGNGIYGIEAINAGGSSIIDNDLYITYQRPGTTAQFVCSVCDNNTTSIGIKVSGASAEVEGEKAYIQIFKSGRIQVDPIN